ncbi:hypothetical protein AbraIFM66950_011234 [Aspergillus brasiliensis]|nr:hypothetical protein AbraIFM66950_011234 [Aspergillus brasiliensis]
MSSDPVNMVFRTFNRAVEDIVQGWIHTEEPSMSDVHGNSIDAKSTTTESNGDDGFISDIRERDADKCAITSYSNAMFCEICPDHLLRSPATGQRGLQVPFWMALELWWVAETVARWMKAIFPNPKKPEAVETIRNYITLSPMLKKYWEWGDLVLRPNPKDKENKKELRVQIAWLPLQDHFWKDTVSIRLKPPLIKETALSELVVYQSELFKHVKTGDWITLTTPDPERLPLPSYYLLEMRFVMSLLVRLSGKIVREENCDAK